MRFYTATPDYYNDYICHHGVKGQQWGVRNGPPYPIKENKASNRIHINEGSKKKLNGYTAKDIQNFYDSYPKNDPDYGTKHKNQKSTIYRNMIPQKGFIEMYKSNDAPNMATIAIDVHPNYRHQGVAKSLVKDAVSNMNDLDINRLEWYCKKSNIASYKLATSCGFKVDKNFTTNDWYTLYYGKKL